jgi:hypothetical protein
MECHCCAADTLMGVFLFSYSIFAIFPTVVLLEEFAYKEEQRNNLLKDHSYKESEEVIDMETEVEK